MKLLRYGNQCVTQRSISLIQGGKRIDVVLIANGRADDIKPLNDKPRERGASLQLN